MGKPASLFSRRVDRWLASLPESWLKLFALRTQVHSNILPARRHPFRTLQALCCEFLSSSTLKATLKYLELGRGPSYQSSSGQREGLAKSCLPAWISASHRL